MTDTRKEILDQLGINKSTKELQKQLQDTLKLRYELGSGIKREGTQIMIPKHMGYEEAADTIMDHARQAEEKIDTLVTLEGHSHDCLYAFYTATNKVFGNMIGAQNMSFFGPSPAREYTIRIDYDKTLSVPIHNVKIPGFPADIHVDMTGNEAMTGVGAVVKFTHKRMISPLIKDLEAEIRKQLAESSIFKGKAIDSTFEFINVENFDPESVIYSQQTQRMLDANVFTTIRHTEHAKKNGVAIKRGILLVGKYGTGKTLTALRTAKLCMENNWTFIRVKDGHDVATAIDTARTLQPAMVFAEDIDTDAHADRDDQVNIILNTMDGILSKDAEVMVVLTTNHAEKINRAMMRPGRLDAVIHMTELDREALLRFVVKYGQDDKGNSIIEGKLDGDALVAASKGYPPAFLSEAVNKAKCYAIARVDGDVTKVIKISCQDIVDALTELRPQFDMMNGEAESRREPTLHETVSAASEEGTQKALGAARCMQ